MLNHPVTLYCGPYFIVSTMQAGNTPIFNIFGMTGPNSNWESHTQNLLVGAMSHLSVPFTISRGYWGPIRHQGAPSGAPTPDPHGECWGRSGYCGSSWGRLGRLINALVTQGDLLSMTVRAAQCLGPPCGQQFIIFLWGRGLLNGCTAISITGRLPYFNAVFISLFKKLFKGYFHI